MKGEAENTIVRIIIALIVLGVIVTVLYLGLGPFRDTVIYNSCKAQLTQYCGQKKLGETPTSTPPCIPDANNIANRRAWAQLTTDCPD